jgi:hypothetical protein
MDALNIIMTASQFQPVNLMLLDCRPNMIMSGKFTKVMYSDECITLNNISLILPLEHTKISGVSSKTFLSFSSTARNNSKVIADIIGIEDYILNYYMQMTGSQKMRVSSLHDHLQNGYIKIYPSGTGSGTGTTYVLRISGVWEDDTRVGLTYKLMQGTA